VGSATALLGCLLVIVQGAPLILKLVLASLLMRGGVMDRDRLSDLLAGRRDIEDLCEPLIGA
jgi:hypothetical protein